MDPCAQDRLATATAPHPSRDALDRLLRGESSRPEARTVVRHLLRGCSQCRQVTRRLWALGEQPRPDTYQVRKLVRATEEPL